MAFAYRRHSKTKFHESPHRSHAKAHHGRITDLSHHGSDYWKFDIAGANVQGIFGDARRHNGCWSADLRRDVCLRAILSIASLVHQYSTPYRGYRHRRISGHRRYRLRSSEKRYSPVLDMLCLG
jgi:hypothetical protein